MKILSLIPATVLVLSVAACSSGSSNDPEPDTSTNNVPADTILTVDEDAQADDPTAGANTETDAATDGENAETDAATDGENTETDAATSDNDTGTEEPADNAEAPDINEDTTTPVIAPDSNLGQLISRIQLLAGTAVLDLNQSLNQGELLSDQENECVGSFDPGLGEPLLSIDCEQPLAVSDVPIYLGSATLEDSPACRGGLQNNNVSECNVVSAILTISTLWIIPPTAEGQPERPQPKAGASINYDAESGRLSFENLEAAISGFFECEYDLSNGNFAGTNASSDCDAQAARLVLLIDEHLASNQ